MHETLYVWFIDLTDGGTSIFLSRANSPSEAVERIALKIASQAIEPDTIFNIDQHLRSQAPVAVDFAEGVGSIYVPPVRPNQQ